MTSPPQGNPDTTGVSAWRRASSFERGIYSNLARWVAGRPDVGPAGTVPVAYVGIVRTTIWVWIGASAVEMAAVHLLVPWPWLRWPLLLVSLWGLVWMFGYLGGLIVHPHLLEPDRLRVRNGHTVEVEVPLAAIQAATTSLRSMEASRVVQLDPDDDRHLLIAMSSQVNVHVNLAEERAAMLPGGRYTFRRLSFWADDPDTVMHVLRQAIGSPRT